MGRHAKYNLQISYVISININIKHERLGIEAMHYLHHIRTGSAVLITTLPSIYQAHDTARCRIRQLSLTCKVAKTIVTLKGMPMR